MLAPEPALQWDLGGQGRPKPAKGPTGDMAWLSVGQGGKQRSSLAQLVPLPIRKPAHWQNITAGPEEQQSFPGSQPKASRGFPAEMLP